MLSPVSSGSIPNFQKTNSAKPQFQGVGSVRFGETPKDSAPKTEKSQNDTGTKNLQDEHNKRLGKAATYQFVVPIASSALWFIPLVGPFIGLTTAYLSGKKGRKLREQVNAEHADAIQNFDKLSGMIKESKGAKNSQQIGQQFDLMMESFRLIQWPGLLNHVMPRLFTGLAKLNLGNSSLVTNSLRYASLGRKASKGATKAEQGAIAAERFGLGVKVLGRVFKAVDINWRVATADSFFDAIVQGGKGMILYSLGPIGFVLDMLGMLKGHKKEKNQEAATA